MKKKSTMAILICLAVLAAIGGGVAFWRWYAVHRPGVRLVSKVLTRDYGGDWKVLDEYEYDDAGNLLRQVRYRTYSASEDKIEYRYEYGYDELGRKISEMYYSYDIVGDGFNCWKYAYEYDNDGNLIKKAEVRDDGSFRIWLEYSYDAVGNKTRETTYENNDGETVRGRLREYEYDDAGNQTKYVEYWAEDTINDWRENAYEYDTNGNPVKYVGYDREGNVLIWHEYEYDASGNMIKEIWCSADGTAVRWYQYTYGEFGVLTEEVSTTYGNDDGILTEMQYPEGNLEIRAEYEYDRSGVLRKRSVYHPQSYDYAGGWEDYTYDSNGNLLKVEYWEGNGRGDRSRAGIRRETKYQYIVIDRTE